MIPNCINSTWATSWQLIPNPVCKTQVVRASDATWESTACFTTLCRENWEASCHSKQNCPCHYQNSLFCDMQNYHVWQTWKRFPLYFFEYSMHWKGLTSEEISLPNQTLINYIQVNYYKTLFQIQGSILQLLSFCLLWIIHSASSSENDTSRKMSRLKKKKISVGNN